MQKKADIEWLIVLVLKFEAWQKVMLLERATKHTNSISHFHPSKKIDFTSSKNLFLDARACVKWSFCAPEIFVGPSVQVRFVTSLQWENIHVWAEIWRKESKISLNYRYVCIGYGPVPVTVKTRFNISLVGNPYKPLFATITGRGATPKICTTIEKVFFSINSVQKTFRFNSSCWDSLTSCFL